MIELSRQRIAVLAGVCEPEDETSAAGDAHGGRIGAALFGEGAFLYPRARKQRHHPVVALMTPGLLVNAIGLVALLGVFLLHCPGSRPRRGILDGDGVLDRVRVQTRPPCDQMP